MFWLVFKKNESTFSYQSQEKDFNKVLLKADEIKNDFNYSSFTILESKNGSIEKVYPKE